MDTFKVDHYVRANQGKPFPWFEQVPSSQLVELRHRLATRLGLPQGAAGLELVSALRRSAARLRPLNALSSKFQFDRVLESIGVPVPKTVLLNWNQFDHVDRMHYADFRESLEFLWYPNSDDLDVLDANCTWSASIGYGGEVFVWVAKQ